MRMRCRQALWLCLPFAGALLLPAAARGWGDEGHEIICEIAWRRLTPGARALVRELRAADRKAMRSFARSCTWADRARDTTHRGTAEYHFVNIARGARGFDRERDCPAYDCVPIAIRRYAAYLVREELAAAKRAEALRFVAHFVGDAHQPLHAAHGEDRGGNDVLVDWPGKPASGRGEVSLHAVWDVLVLRRGGLTTPRSAATLAAGVSDAEAAAWAGLEVEDWVDESYRLAVGVAYDLPADRVLGSEYFERALPVVEEQLTKAGVRLAQLLNSAAAGSRGSTGR